MAADLRTLLAIVLGAGLGLLLVARPDFVIRVQTAGRLPRDRGGEYGADAPGPDRWRSLVRLLGVACLLVAGYLAAGAVGLIG